jgi:hypothetical protein
VVGEAWVLKDQLYLVKVDNEKGAVVVDHDGKVLLGVAEALGKENEVNIAKKRWLSRRHSEKAYGSTGVFLTKGSDVKRLLQGQYFFR